MLVSYVDKEGDYPFPSGTVSWATKPAVTSVTLLACLRQHVIRCEELSVMALMCC